MTGIDDDRLALAAALTRDEVDEVLSELDEQIELLRTAQQRTEAHYREMAEAHRRAKVPRSGLDVAHPRAVVSTEVMFLAEQHDTATKESYRKVAAWFADIAVLALEEAVHGTPVEPARVVAVINPGLLSRPQLLEVVDRYRPGLAEDYLLEADDARHALWGSEWNDFWLCRLPDMSTLDRLPRLSEEVFAEIRAALKRVLLAVQSGQTAFELEDCGRPLTVDELARACALNSDLQRMPELLSEFARVIRRGLPALRAAG
ncbi:hypothetical protein NLX83_40570 [Allokutzneria sp. A3M-2-11 16]|uniref:hypothetical protein n=1 Tax=Allokutzneria sp. A3M-2-11 16 TaxID=2962043 RepID=UPI0020B8FFB4|nr:hypothetical protein [Allokutzneria sp. A3M-2-11 16]MCP3805577.1 hypothetical protein [Allokutzneria sp. A3M-2-11 16]